MTQTKRQPRLPFLYLAFCNDLLHTISNSTFGQIVWGHLNFHFVAGKNTNVVLAHAAGNMGCDGVAILKFYPESGVRQGIHYRAFKFYGIVFGHALNIRGGSATKGANDATKETFLQRKR